MKFLISILLSGILAFIPFASAASDDSGEVAEPSPPTSVYNLPDGAVGEEWELTDVQLLTVTTPVESSSGIKGVLLDILGSYDPPVVQYAYSGSNGYTSYIREVVPDYPFIASVLVLLLFLYGAIKMGCVLCRR